MALKNWSKKEFLLKSLNDGSSDFWTASGSGTDEYYYNQSDLPEWPVKIYEDGMAMAEGTIGSLASGEFVFGDNDTIGSTALYVRLTDDADPDTKAADFIEVPDIFTLVTGGAGNAIILLSCLLSNNETGTIEVQSMAEATLATGDVYALSYNGKTLTSTAADASPTTTELVNSLTGGDNAATYAEMPFILLAGTSAVTITWKKAGDVDNLCTAVKTTGSGTPTVTQTTNGTGDIDFIVYFTTSADVVYHQFAQTITMLDGPFGLDLKMVLNDEDKVKIQATLPNCSVMISGDES